MSPGRTPRGEWRLKVVRKRKPWSDRERLIDLVRARLRRHGLARLQMTVIVIATGVAGFLASAALVHLGVTSMGLRYGIAFVIAYGVFLGLVRLWVELYRRRIDGADALDDIPDVYDVPDPSAVLGAGGDFGGAGASGDWDDAAVAASGASSGKGSGGGIGGALDLDEGWVIVVPIVMLLGSLIAAFVLIWSAPGLLAELALDVFLVSRLYRRLEHLDRRSWLMTAIRKTWIPALVVGVLVVAGGSVIQAVVPEARTMGDVLR